MAISDFKLINGGNQTLLDNVATNNGMVAYASANAADVNSVFRQNSLVVVALMQALNDFTGVGSLTPFSSLSDMKSYIKAQFTLGNLQFLNNTLTVSLGNQNKNINLAGLVPTNATTASKLGSSTIGSGIKPIYLNLGTPIASSSTIGGSYTPIRLDGGEFKALGTRGSSTKPVYIDNSGVISECNTYSGATKTTLNGTDKGGDSINIYAPTTSGTSGQVLKSSGSGAPSWNSMTLNECKSGRTTSLSIEEGVSYIIVPKNNYVKTTQKAKITVTTSGPTPTLIDGLVIKNWYGPFFLRVYKSDGLVSGDAYAKNEIYYGSFEDTKIVCETGTSVGTVLSYTVVENSLVVSSTTSFDYYIL